MHTTSSRDNSSRYRELISYFSSACGQREIDVPSHMDAIRVKLEHHGSDMNAACTHDRDYGCWLLSQLPAWNEILAPVGVCLYEEKFQNLTVKVLSDKADVPLLLEGDTVAAGLVYLLLKEHRCIRKFTMHSHILMPLPLVWRPLLKMSLKASQGLRSVDLTFAEWTFDDSTRDFLDGVAQLDKLQEFRLSSECRHGPVAQSIGQIVKKHARHLKTLTVTPQTFETQYVQEFVSDLAMCTSLSSLELDNVPVTEIDSFVQFMTENKTVTALKLGICTIYGMESVARILSANRALVKLHLSCTTGYFYPGRSLLRALEGNTTLKYFHCECVSFCSEGVRALDRVLKVNRTLSQIVLNNDLINSSILGETVAEAIPFNGTLTEMDLSGNDFETHSVILLAEALAKNSTLSKLRVSVSADSWDLPSVWQAMERTQTCDRLVLLWPKNTLPRKVSTLRASSFFRQIRISDFSPPEETAEELFYNLSHNKFLTHFCLEGRQLSDDVWHRVGSFLAANNTIETLELIHMFPLSDSSREQLSMGLARNSSIRRIKISAALISRRDVTPLKWAFERNRSVTTVQVEGYYPYEEWPCFYLSRSVVVKHCKRTGITESFQATLQRNPFLVNEAVRFVLHPTTDRSSAGIFHEYQHSPEMLRKLQEATAGSEAEAKRRILCAANFVEDHFWVIVGVVQTNLVCHRAGGGKVLQDLDSVCQRKILSYLRVFDIVH